MKTAASLTTPAAGRGSSTLRIKEMFHVKHRRIKEEEPMTDTVTVAIPDDVKDNNQHTVMVHWRGTIPQEENAAALAVSGELFGYTVRQWDDVDRDKNRVTLTRMDRADGENVWLYETSYFTRVVCVDCTEFRAQSYAEYYMSVVNDRGDATPPVPLCGLHLHRQRRLFADAATLTVHVSEPLRIGQHD